MNSKYIKILVSSILAGISIGLGGTIFLSIDDKIIGSLLFSIGLFVVCTFNLDLFTGKICFCIDRNNKYTPVNYILIWLGNILGTKILSELLLIARISDNLIEKSTGLYNIKINDSYISLFFLGVLCNIFIFIAVYGYKNNNHQLGKYLSIIFGVMGFILCGSEHCIADAFYIFMSNQNFIDILPRLVIISVGNMVGGIASNYVLSIIQNNKRGEQS